jgi:hypothetical protein
VTAPLIAPVIPSSARPSAPGRRAAGSGRRLPVADVPLPPAVPNDVPADDTLTAYSFAVVDQAVRACGAFPHGRGGRP